MWSFGDAVLTLFVHPSSRQGSSGYIGTNMLEITVASAIDFDLDFELYHTVELPCLSL